MSEPNSAPPAVDAPESVPATVPSPAETSATPVESSGDKALSNKELKELKKKEKAAKRAAAKEAMGVIDNGPGEPASVPLVKDQSSQTAAINANIEKKKAAKSASHIKKQFEEAKVKKDVLKIPPMFGHLETREQRIASSPSIASIVHPSILALTLKISTYRVVGSTARCAAMLEAFKDVITDYETPDGTSLQRNLTSHLSHQIEYLKSGRPLSISMGNAIRWLKQKISLIPIDSKDEESRSVLKEQIDEFINEKIKYSDKVIIQMASKHITNGCSILTYGHSEVLKELFKYCAIDENKTFSLVIVDSKPLFEGKKLARELSMIKNIKCHYILINALNSILESLQIDTVFLGAHSMLSNGRLYSRVGSALVAMSANNKNIPVLVCCESMKFSDKVQLDSVTLNELGDGDDLINTKPSTKPGFNLEQYMSQLELQSNDSVGLTNYNNVKSTINPQNNSALPKSKNSNQNQNKNNNNNTNNNNNNNRNNNNNNRGYSFNNQNESNSNESSKSLLSNWKDIDKLNILNILYDLTPPEYIQKIITEVGALPPSSVPVILREYKATN